MSSLLKATATLAAVKEYATATCHEIVVTPQEELEKWGPLSDYTSSSESTVNSSSGASLASSRTGSIIESLDSQDSNSGPMPPVVAIIGCGYVGEHLCRCFGEHFRVIALDVSEKRVEQLKNDDSFPPRVSFTTDSLNLSAASHFLIAVPTGVKEDKSIDDSHLQAAIRSVKNVAKNGSTVVIESSVAVGMSRTLLEPLMREMNLKGGMSPERIDPGRPDPPAHKIPKVISGLDDITPGSLESIQEIYCKAFETVVSTSRPEVAEMCKLYENCQRMILATYANEMSDACRALGIDPFEVQSACQTKPFGYQQFTPGLGVGGHCIAVNPYYLFSTCQFPLLRQATDTTISRPARLAKQLAAELVRRQIANPKVLVVGVAFKKGQSSVINSPAVLLLQGLREVADVSFADPKVAQETVPWASKFDHTTQWTREELNKFHLIVVAVKQPGLSYELLHEVDSPVETFAC